MQFNRDVSGKMTPLPKPSIDTGLGLERIAAVIQNVPTNYDTDLILPIMKKVEDLSEKRFGDPGIDIAMKVIADHSRAAAFLSETEFCPQMKDGDMYCVGSCAGRFDTAAISVLCGHFYIKPQRRCSIS